jgi:hypothetical protein
MSRLGLEPEIPAFARSRTLSYLNDVAIEVGVVCFILGDV